MAKRIFVTATNTDIGKTYATKLLLTHYASLGYRVAALKPIETGVDTLPADATVLLELMHTLNPQSHTLHINDITPLQFSLPAAPYVANHAKPIDLSAIDTALEKLEAVADIVIIEGAGGVLVPIDPDTMIIDLIARYQAKALLIGHCRLGCINDILLNIHLLKSRNIAFEWALNCRNADSAFNDVSRPYFRDTFKTFFTLQKDLNSLSEALLK